MIYYIKINYMFRPFSLAIFRLINEKFSKQLHLTCVDCIQWGGKMRSGNAISHVVVLCVINCTYRYHRTVVLDRCTRSNLVYYNA